MKIGNCQIGVSVHAVGSKGTVPLGWALYLPEDWCEDPERRRKAKIPDEVEFKTKPELGVELIERAAGWEIGEAPVLGDCAYGDKTELRARLDVAGREYVLAVSPDTTVFAPETIFEVPEPRGGGSGRQKTRPRPDRKPEAIGALIAALDAEQFQTITFRDGPNDEPMTSVSAACRVIACGLTVQQLTARAAKPRCWSSTALLAPVARARTGVLCDLDRVCQSTRSGSPKSCG